MKKIIIGSLIAASFMFGENIAYLFENDLTECPNLSADHFKCYSCSEDEKNEILKKEIQALISDLKKKPVKWDIYEKALQNYNHTERIDEYVGAVTWFGIYHFPIHESLVNLKESINNNPSESKEELEKLQNEYTRLISLIEPKNSNWCYEIANKDISKYSEELMERYREKPIENYDYVMSKKEECLKGVECKTFLNEILKDGKITNVEKVRFDIKLEKL